MRLSALLALSVCLGLVVVPGLARGQTGAADEAQDLLASPDGVDLDRIDLGDGGVTATTATPLAAKIRALKAEAVARRAAARTTTATAAAETVVVDCNQGKSIQDAIDKKGDPLVVEVRGVCHENVRIDHRQVTLRGTDPAVDGIQGVAATPAVPALSIYFSDGLAVQNLSFSDGPDRGVGMWFSHVTMAGCRIEGNGNVGLWVSSNSGFDGFELTISDNGGRGLHVQRSATAFCTGCVVADNGGVQAASTTGGILSLLDSSVSGRHGVQASFDGAYADIDCVSSPTTGVPCEMAVTGRAAFAFAGSDAALYGAGDFTGQVVASDRGHVYVYGARQTAPGTTAGGSPIPNNVSQLATLTAEPYVDGVGVAHESQLKGHTSIDAFSRALLLGETVLDGTLACDRGGDAWADPGVTVTAGGAITGCDHASAP